ncbi:MAG: alanine--tRNA ligase [Alphaproteobacteria bacterium]|nr:alanine--tRNA ligase [Alphaproteobacteria bacterium]
MRLTDIRSTFLDYFKKQDHTIVESSPLVPRNDPTLMFTAAGMVQFKDVFTGTEKRAYTRATSSQKCLRAGGKHNDLDNVGYTTRHHTFFEMLGNFSFGDYFKEEAIFYAWDLVTKHFHLDPKRLLVTVYADDHEAASIWKKITGFSDDKILRIATSDNFWSMGDTGPCGPCTEIFYDHGEHIAGGPPGSPDEDGDRFTEIWNLVFMQYEKFADGTQTNLPKPSVDTGMGLERIGAVLQGVHSNFETDLFKALIEASKDLTHNSGMQQSHQVIADHLRASCFLLADGVLPSNEGRGYVLRRIMRRGMRHGHLLGAKDTLMHRLAPTLIDLMGVHYPELKRAESLMISTLKQEEERFRETLGRGMKLLSDEVKKLSSEDAFPGDVAFKLYDTYGFPMDLTADVLRGDGRALDTMGFDAAMNAQKQAARATWVGSGDTKNDKIWFEVKEKAGSTDFLGYESLHAEAMITAIVVDGNMVMSASRSDVISGKSIYVMCNQTPFYGESGGQMGDHGSIESPMFKGRVVNTLKFLDGLIVHDVGNLEGTLKVGDAVKLDVDDNRRHGLRQHHSVTHLLHAALRQILGEHVMQKGSLVEQDRLRFDFAHTKSMLEEELLNVENLVNQHIQQNIATQTQLKTPEEAIQSGAMALFGEKYGDSVRVVSMGDASTELCGGTHVNATGEIGLFKIISESGIASGVRRIEAVAGMAALTYVRSMDEQKKLLSHTLKAPPEQMVEKVTRLIEEQKSLQQQITDLRHKLAAGESTKEILEVINNVKLLIKHLEGYATKDLKTLMDTLKESVGSGVVLLSNVTDEGKVALLLGVTNDLIHRFDAGKIISEISSPLGSSKGGGRADMAQAGGNDPSGLPKCEERIRLMLQG